MDAAQTRRVQNETLFREVNERIEELSIGLAGLSEPDEFLGGFVCECGSEGCSELLQVRHTEYEAIRSDPSRFLIVAAHEDLEVERVVERHERYWVVEKVGEASDLAVEQDPRS